MKKRITIDQLRPGMYVTAADKGWLYLPFFSRKIKSERVVDKLRDSGVLEVIIDLTKGRDVDQGSQPVERPQQPQEKSPPAGEAGEVLHKLEQSRELHDGVLSATSDMMERVRKGEMISEKEADIQVNQLVDQVLADSQSLLCISVLKNTGEYVFNHCIHTSILVLFLGRSLGMARNEMLALGKGALLHDIGKCMVPKEILHKPGRLSHEEFEIMRNHVSLGVRYLEKANCFGPDVISFVAQHHERMNGSGYPLALRGEDISWTAKLGIVVDIYDTLIHKNYYKTPEDPGSVLDTMSRMTLSLIDKDAFEALAKCLGAYPPGTLMLLDTGEMAVSYEPNLQMPDRPKVLVVTRPDGIFCSPPIPALLSEPAENGEGFRRSVVTSLSPEDANFDPLAYLSGNASNYQL